MKTGELQGLGQPEQQLLAEGDFLGGKGKGGGGGRAGMRDPVGSDSCSRESGIFPSSASPCLLPAPGCGFNSPPVAQGGGPGGSCRGSPGLPVHSRGPRSDATSASRSSTVSRSSPPTPHPIPASLRPSKHRPPLRPQVSCWAPR